MKNNLILGSFIVFITYQPISCMNQDLEMKARRKEFKWLLKLGEPTTQNTKRLQELLSKGIGDINKPPYLPLNIAVARMVPTWVQMLLDAGARAFTNEKFATSPMHMCLPLQSPLLKNNKHKLSQALTIIDLLLNHGANINARDYISRGTLLHYACSIKEDEGVSPEALEYILTRGANPCVKDVYRKTSIDYALTTHGLDSLIYKLLIKNVQERFFKSVKNANIHAIKEALLARAKLSRTDDSGDNVFHVAARLDNPEIFTYLLSLPITHIYKYLIQHNNDGETPIAIVSRNPELEKILEIVVGKFGQK